MTDETPDTSTDTTPGDEGDSDQLPFEDTLEDRGVEDLLDEGYTPPERPRANHYGETPWEEAHGEPLDQRLAEEEPEVWEGSVSSRPADRRAGRLVADDDAFEGHQVNDTFAEEVGIDGGAASAEEAAVHVIDEP